MLTEQMRQLGGRQADMLDDADDIKMTVRQMVADILAGFAHTAIHRRMQRLIELQLYV